MYVKTSYITEELNLKFTQLNKRIIEDKSQRTKKGK